MKQFLKITASLFTTVCILSGNPHEEILIQDPMLEKYSNLLIYTDYMSGKERDSILNFIKTDQITVMRMNYYCKMTGK